MSDLSNVKAGKYRITARFWDEITSKPGQPTNFTRHRKGDVVDLDVTEARRLVKAGAVEPAKKAKEPEPPAPPAGTDSRDAAHAELLGKNIPEILEVVANNAELAALLLELETGEGGKARKSLVADLEGIIAAAAGGNG